MSTSELSTRSSAPGKKVWHQKKYIRRPLDTLLLNRFSPNAPHIKALSMYADCKILDGKFGLWDSSLRKTLQTISLYVAICHEGYRHNHALVFYIDMAGMGGFAELQTDSRLVTPMSIDELFDTFDTKILELLALEAMVLNQVSQSLLTSS